MSTNPATLWRDILPESQIITGQGTEPYTRCTSGRPKSIAAVLRPMNEQQIIAIVHAANAVKIPLYPISTGHNWGYGSATPVRPDSVIVDLSDMTNIDAFDPDSGLITLEPGVTQQNLYDFLTDHAAPYLTPTTGAGPQCSLVGNALERGYGITPLTDHFAAVTRIEAILANGEHYRSPITEMGLSDLDGRYKWGVGPYLDGLFAQGAFGIVTKMRFQLAPKPEKIGLFVFSLNSDHDLMPYALALQSMLKALPGGMGAVNLLNQRRMLSMTDVGGVALSETEVDQLSRSKNIQRWSGLGTLYGSKAIYEAVKYTIKKHLGPKVKQLSFLSPTLVRMMDRVVQMIPSSVIHRFPGKLKFLSPDIVKNLQGAFNIASGKPSEVALPLAYRKDNLDKATYPLNPARDECGLIWYSPLVPMVPDKVLAYNHMIEDICPQYGIEPLITLTSLSPFVFDSSIPLRFDTKDTNQTERAHACFTALFEEGLKQGFLPYRVGSHHMDHYTKSGTSYWSTVKTLKRAIDVNNILSPGRYTL